MNELEYKKKSVHAWISLFLRRLQECLTLETGFHYFWKNVIVTVIVTGQISENYNYFFTPLSQNFVYFLNFFRAWNIFLHELGY